MLSLSVNGPSYRQSRCAGFQLGVADIIQTAPGIARGFVNFSTREAEFSYTPRDEHVSVWQQRGNVLVATVVESTGTPPRLSLWIVKLGARELGKKRT